uniref:Uncharacterized protein n=1 Tax=Oryza barthii TaxID=65489 RepID=A0A0D3GG06_9ORYZ
MDGGGILGGGSGFGGPAGRSPSPEASHASTTRQWRMLARCHCHRARQVGAAKECRRSLQWHHA